MNCNWWNIMVAMLETVMLKFTFTEIVKGCHLFFLLIQMQTFSIPFFKARSILSQSLQNELKPERPAWPWPLWWCQVCGGRQRQGAALCQSGKPHLLSVCASGQYPARSTQPPSGSPAPYMPGIHGSLSHLGMMSDTQTLGEKARIVLPTDTS